MTKEFKTLQKEWYDRLQKEGFKDIEKEEKTLRGKFKSKQVEQIIGYYDKAQSFLNDYEFPTPKHKKVWERHTRGESVRKIAEALKFSKSDVHRIIKRYESIMLGAY